MSIPVLKNQLADWQYGWTVTNLQNCLSDHLTALVQYELFKCPNNETSPQVTMTPPFVYVDFIPASYISPEGIDDVPLVPSILIDCHEGEVDIKENSYTIRVRLLVSLWDNNPDFGGSQDRDHLTEKVFLDLLKNRSLMQRYNLIGRAKWFHVNSKRKFFFLSAIELEYELGQAPDASDNVDIFLQENDHTEHFDYNRNLDNTNEAISQVDVLSYSPMPGSPRTGGDRDPGRLRINP